MTPSKPFLTDNLEEQITETSEPLEDINDVGEISIESISQAVVSANDWTTETIINQINKGNINLDPAFQRRDAWKGDRKSSFIESLILGMPIPQLVLAETKGRKGNYFVIDGKQRLLAIRQFAAEADDKEFKQLQLSGLSIRKDLTHLSLNDLRSDNKYIDDLSSFENQPIRTVVIRNWPNEDFLYQVFLRLNTGSVALSPQELRQALHPGPFVTFVDFESGKSKALRQILKISTPDFRMRDTELLIRFYAFNLFLPEYRGDLKKFLDFTCMKLNEKWITDNELILGYAELFESAYQVAVDVFGQKHVFHKWNFGNYESFFNRAVFDIFMYSFSVPEQQQIIIQNREKVEALFKSLCEDDYNFKSSLERTTKSLESTCLRLHTWTSKLNEAIGTTLHVPSLVGGRIQ